MPDPTILVVEDDTKIRTLLRNVLEDDGFVVLEAQTGAQVMGYLETEDLCLVTLDLTLGSENGIEIARAIKRVSEVPIIMVTGKEDVIDRVVGLEVGADDYITKPFHVREVLARIRTVLRRTQAWPSPVADVVSPPQDGGAGRALSFDGMTAVLDEMTLIDRAGEPCKLTSSDFSLLDAFLNRSKRVLSRDQLMDLTGGPAWSPLDRTIDNQIARLRKKIERNPSKPELIKTVRGVGYLFACDVTRA